MPAVTIGFMDRTLFKALVVLATALIGANARGADAAPAPQDAPMPASSAAAPDAAAGGKSEPGDWSHWRLFASPYTLHFRYSDEHQYVWAVGVERQRYDNWLAGASYFSNSFGQPSGYLYLGQRYTGLLDKPPLFFQWSVGLLYGYKGKYEDKVPFNHNGYSPGATVSLGWQFNRNWAGQMIMLGDAGLMFQLSYDLR
jgi:hypothetical protein